AGGRRREAWTTGLSGLPPLTVRLRPDLRRPTSNLRDRISLVPIVNIQDLRAAARRRLPRSVFDYIDGGAEGEVTLRENVRAFEDVTFRPRSAVKIPAPDLRTTVLGTPLALPLIFAPDGSSRL